MANFKDSMRADLLDVHSNIGSHTPSSPTAAIPPSHSQPRLCRRLPPSAQLSNATALAAGAF